jgi:MoaA/NifB/PqqE/SkfB family radical SAM enzyme
MCGRRKLENKNPELCNWGDMDLELVYYIIDQLPKNILIQFHSNGEPLLYPYLKEILNYSHNQIRCLNTNGKLLVEKANDIIDNLDTLTISVIENDPEGDEQYEIVKKFLKLKGDKKPFMIYRLLGDVGKFENKDSDEFDYSNEQQKRIDRWYELPGLVATRILHNPMGSFGYEKKVTIPEHGICMDLLSHLVINRFGLVSLCVRFDPYNELVVGDTKITSLEDIWNGDKRISILNKHIEGKRMELPYCGSKCKFWGCPTGA